MRSFMPPSVTNRCSKPTTYRVIEVEIIFPDDADKIRIQRDRDLLSIFTCTYPNTRRVLVTCERTKEE